MHAPQSADTVTVGNGQLQFCSFYLSGRLYGVDILDVKEICPETSITPIPQAPKEVRGYVNIRGQVYLILDLRFILGVEPDSLQERCCLVIFKPTVGESFGLVVDRIGDVIVVNENEIENRRRMDHGPKGGTERRLESEKLVNGICKLSNSLMIILNCRRFLDQIEVTR